MNGILVKHYYSLIPINPCGYNADFGSICTLSMYDPYFFILNGPGCACSLGPLKALYKSFYLPVMYCNSGLINKYGITSLEILFCFTFTTPYFFLVFRDKSDEVFCQSNNVEELVGSSSFYMWRSLYSDECKVR